MCAMKTSKPLIIQLLIADMKHEQLVAGLNHLGFESDLHGTDLNGVVAELMGIPEMDMEWDWFDVYMKFLDKASDYPITGDGKNLLPLAEACYEMLEGEMVNSKRRKVNGEK